jgi:ferredoxin
MQLEQHPTVQKFRRQPPAEPQTGQPLDSAWLRQLCLKAGADDVGFVEIGRAEVADQEKDILANFPQAKTLISFLVRMNRGNVQSPARSIANLEFHRAGDEVNDIAHKIVAQLESLGIRARNGAAVGFPMEMDRWGNGKTWVISHKPIAVAAGLGHMGIHRNVIHPKFGNFVILGTVVTEATVSQPSQALDYNPCLECKLCVAACPTGAIGADGQFNFSACYTHNYREFMGGFSDWVDKIADSASARQYRRKMSDAETVSMWQSLSFGANYKAAYCMAVCPAGEEVIAPFLTQRKQYLDEVVRPLQNKPETVYVIAGSDAEAYVARRFPVKQTKRVSNGLRVRSIGAFLKGLPMTFQRGRAAGLNAVFHFTFTGGEERKATVVIRDQAIQVSEGHLGNASFSLKADAETWLRFLRKETSLVAAVLRRKISFRGSPRLLLAFARCFPS